MSDEASEVGPRARSDAASRLAALLAESEAPSPSPPPAPGPSPADPSPSPAGPPRRPIPPRGGEVAARPAPPTEPIPHPATAPPQPPAPAARAAPPRTTVPEARLATEPRVRWATEPQVPPVIESAPRRPAEPEPRPAAARAPGSASSTRPTSTPQPAQARPSRVEAPPPPTGSSPTDPPSIDLPPPAGARPKRVTPRAAAFATALLLLVATVPALSWVGQRRLLDSRGGQIVRSGGDPTDPGYRALVDPTQAAMVIHRDDDGAAASVTVLALGAGQTGGTVLLVPLETQLRVPQYLINRLRGMDDGPVERLAAAVEDRLNVAIPEVIELTDDDLAALVGPVAPLAIDNSDPVVTDAGDEVAPGPVNLAAEDVGPFLRATNEGESELGHLARSESVWDAWLEAIGQATGDDSVGAATTGIGPFLRQLADGDPVVETLDVEPSQESGDGVEGDVAPALTPAPGFDEQVIDAVPFPRSPGPGRRWSLKLLNGVSGDPLPRPVMRSLILEGASLETLGNADDFGRQRTLIEYSGDGGEETARAARQALGDTAKVEELTDRRAEAEAEDVIVTLGEDALDFIESQSPGDEEDGGG